MKKGVLWTGLILIVVTLSILVLAQERPTQFEPLQAKIVIENTNPNQAATTGNGQFYRDAAGRTRVEMGRLITITDPVARTRYVLDTEQHIAHKMPLPPDGPGRRGLGDSFMPPPPPPPPPPAGANGAPPTGPPSANGLMPPPRPAGAGAPPSPPPPPAGPPPERKDLGTRQIDGLTAQGWEITRQLPPPPDAAAGSNLTETVQTWVSDELKLPLLTEATVSDGHKHTRHFVEVQRNATVDAALFAVPVGYEVVEGAPPPPPLPRQ